MHVCKCRYGCKVNDMYVKLWYNQIRMIWKTKKTPTRESKGQLVGYLDWIKTWYLLSSDSLNFHCFLSRWLSNVFLKNLPL